MLRSPAAAAAANPGNGDVGMALAAATATANPNPCCCWLSRNCSDMSCSMRNWCPWSGWPEDERPNSGGLPMGDDVVPENGDGRCGGSPIGILSKPPTPKGLCSGMDMAAAVSTIDGGGGGGAGPDDCGGGGCRLSRGGMLSASGRADMPGSDDALPDEQPDEPSDEHDELLFLDSDTGDGVPSV